MRGIPQPRRGYGLALAFIAANCFALTVILLGVVLNYIDLITTTVARSFLAAALITGYLLARTKGTAQSGKPTLRSALLLIAIGIAFASYLTAANAALMHISPGAVQIAGQFSILLTVMASVVLLGESFNRLQASGLATLLVGLGLFFHSRLGDFSLEGSDYAKGLFFMLISTIAFAACIIMQKVAVRTFASSRVILYQFWIGAIILLPFAKPTSLIGIPATAWLPLTVIAFTTVLGSGLYAEALKQADASRVTPVISLSPLLTILLSYPALLIWPGAFHVDPLDFLSIAGAVLVVTGSAIAATATARKPAALYSER